MVEALFWPALLGYGEAAFAYASARTTRAATWGVRLGWIAQTALLSVQAARADGFPWSSWAGSLNLFVWLVVGAYLIWGCRPRFRLLGLTVMPLAAALFVVARVGGGTRGGARTDYGNLFLVLHVGFVLAAFAGFTLAAALAGLFLWQERRLKRRAADILRLRLPPLASLERLTWRTIAVSLPLLTLGLGAGIVRLREERHGVDALELVTVLTWLVYGGFVALRPTGRRAAFLALGGFALVVVARLVLSAGHFT
ncbi:MAG TPA: cytochrome c biogenesis protein CcsA [Gaiellaceae bacterium]